MLSSPIIKRGNCNAAADGAENLMFEWVTTDWSKCSQTCGGSGFQVRLIRFENLRLLQVANFKM